MAKDTRAQLAQLTKQVDAALGSNLVTLAVYGPAIRHDTREGERLVTTLLIVADASPAALKAVEPSILEWTRKGYPPPLVFADEEWRRSTDVFPMEIEDMREAHEILLGADPFSGLVTTRADLRRELEREIRGKLLRLRTEFVAAAARGKALEDLLLDSAGTFFVIFRAVLRLTGHTPPQTPRALVQETAAVAGLDVKAFEWVIDKLVGHNVPSLKAHDPAGDRYVEQIEHLAQFVDRYESPGANQAPT
jgi:hypothetical protein